MTRCAENKHIFLLVLAAFMLFQSCKQKGSGNEETSTINSPSSVSQSLSTEVKIVPCAKDIFIKKTLLTGILKARESAVVKSEVGGIINKMTILDGSRIQKNDVLLSLDDTEEQYALEQAKIRYDDAIVKRNDLIIQYGGIPDDENSVKPYQLKVINTNTGYHKTIQDIKELEFRIRRKKVKVPFTGVVADLKVKPHEVINPGQEICTLINPATFEVSFMVMENHALRLNKGLTIRIHPLNAPLLQYTAIISIINPRVNDQGLVEIRAKLSGNANQLYENMNMRVIIEEKTKPYIIIPKTALVRRSERTVVFTYDENDKTAKWNYVTVADENDTHYAISEGLMPGQLVIYEGNLNLDHDAAVSIKAKEE